MYDATGSPGLFFILCLELGRDTFLFQKEQLCKATYQPLDHRCSRLQAGAGQQEITEGTKCQNK